MPSSILPIRKLKCGSINNSIFNRKYAVDGFKLDGGDDYFTSVIIARLSKPTPTDTWKCMPRRASLLSIE
ncbi:MAG: hypothetical protein R3C26_07545 [Calditrichia bacterium]